MKESSISRFKTICIFGSTEFSKNKKHLKASVELDIALGARKINQVYGGDSLGLRGTIAVLAIIGGNRVLGVILKTLAEKRYVTGMIIGNKL